MGVFGNMTGVKAKLCRTLKPACVELKPLRGRDTSAPYHRRTYNALLLLSFKEGYSRPKRL